MPRDQLWVRLSSGEYEVLDEVRLAELRTAGTPRALVDPTNRPALTRRRWRALDRLQRFSWWRSSAQFPEAPDEVRQYNALVDWFFSFGVTSAMLLAPVLASVVIMFWDSRSSPLVPTLGVSIAIIALMLLVLVLQRLGASLWGARGDPGRLLRRLFILALPASAFAAIWWTTLPQPGVRVVGVGAALLNVFLLLLLVARFLRLYFSYTGCTDVFAYLNNAGPRDALLSFYDLLKPTPDGDERGRCLREAVQYLADFQRSVYVGGADTAEPGKWVEASSGQLRTLADMGSDLDKIIQPLYVGARQQRVEVLASAFLLPSGQGASPESVLGCCAIQSSGVGRVWLSPSGDRREDTEPKTEMRYLCHRLVRLDDGWYLEDAAAGTLAEEDLAALRQPGLLP